MSENDNQSRGIFASIADAVGGMIEGVATAVIDFFVGTAESIINAFSDSISARAKSKADQLPKPPQLNQEGTKGNQYAHKYDTYYEELKAWYQADPGYWRSFTYNLLWLVYAAAEHAAKIKLFFYEAQKEAMVDLTPERPDISSVLTNKFRYADIGENDPFYQWLPEGIERDPVPDQTELVDAYRKLLGFDDTEWNFISLGSRPNLAASEILEESRRYRVPEADTVKQLQSLGYTREKAQRITKLKWVLPGPSDLVRFQVREAYYPSYMAKWGSLREMVEDDVINIPQSGEDIYIGNPPVDPTPDNSQFLEDAEKIGLNTYWAKKYWASHWELPSLYQGYEMLHRGVINYNELQQLFKAHDILPGWRKPLEDISWRLPTRVDVRRMYDRGVIDYNDLYGVYEDLGYHEDYRQDMVDFTAEFYQEKDRKLARTLIIKAFRNQLPGYTTRDETIAAMMAIGYKETDAQTIVDLEIERQHEEQLEQQEESLKERWITGALAKWDQVKMDLRTMGYTDAKIQYLYYKWEREKRANDKIVSEHILIDLLAYQKYDPEKFVNEMKRRGYDASEAEQLRIYAEEVKRAEI